MRSKRLRKSDDNEIIFGVMGGLGEYLNIDPVILRIIAVIAFFIIDPEVFFAYIFVSIFVFNDSPSDGRKNKKHKKENKSDYLDKDSQDDRMNHQDNDNWSDF